MISTIARIVSTAADTAIDAYRERLAEQREQSRQAALQFNVLVTSAVAMVGLIADVAALHIRTQSLQQALEDASAAGDLQRADEIRGLQVELLQAEPASARLLSTLADYLPALLGDQPTENVIEGQLR